MSESAKGVGMLLARVLAVVLAVGAVGYFVYNAHVSAQPDDTPPAVEPGATPEEVDPHFIYSSKSFDPSELDEDAFLPSTKGMIGLGNAKEPSAAPAEAPKENKEEDTFLPSSKSLPVGKSVPKQKKP